MKSVKGTVYLVDDDLLLLESLAALLKHEGYRVHAYNSAADFINIMHAELEKGGSEPRCLISDINMPGINGLDLQKALEAYPLLPIILMSGVKKLDHVIDGFRFGAVDFLIKPVDPDCLLNSISSALIKNKELRSKSLEASDFEARVESLNEREKAVICLVAQGLLNKQIADELDIALRTVKLYRRQAMDKLGLKKR